VEQGEDRYLSARVVQKGVIATALGRASAR
jgi:hypothetical protein